MSDGGFFDQINEIFWLSPDLRLVNESNLSNLFSFAILFGVDYKT